MEFSRPEYWSGLPFPSPGDLSNPGIEPRSPAFQADSLPAELHCGFLKLAAISHGALYTHGLTILRASLVAQMVKKKNLPALWEIWVPSLGWKDLLEKGTATHFSILAWRIPWTEEPGGLQSVESQRVGLD